MKADNLFHSTSGKGKGKMFILLIFMWANLTNINISDAIYTNRFFIAL